MFLLIQKKVSSKYFIFADFSIAMAMPALKCPYLAQLNLQQIRTSASYLFNTGAKSCPIFGQLVRRISTTFNFNEIKVVHENILGKNKIKIPTSTGESKEANLLFCNDFAFFCSYHFS
jgi:hypothetical protein